MEAIFNEIKINDIVTVCTDYCWFTGGVVGKHECEKNERIIWYIDLAYNNHRTIQFTSDSITDIKILHPDESKENIRKLADKYDFKYCDKDGTLFEASLLLGSVMSGKAYEKFTEEEKEIFFENAKLKTEDIKNIMDLYVLKQTALTKAGEERLKLLKEQKELIEKSNTDISWPEKLACGLLIAGVGLSSLTDNK